jgi:hypothetical protein
MHIALSAISYQLLVFSLRRAIGPARKDRAAEQPKADS